MPLRPGGLGGRRPADRAQIGEHTSELQSRGHLVCRLLLEKKTSPRPGPRDPFGHMCLECLEQERASSAIQRPAPCILLLEKLLPAGLLEKPLIFFAGVLLGARSAYFPYRPVFR